MQFYISEKVNDFTTKKSKHMHETNLNEQSLNSARKLVQQEMAAYFIIYVLKCCAPYCRSIQCIITQ